MFNAKRGNSLGIYSLMVAVVKRLTRRIVDPLCEGSSPSSHPKYGAVLKSVEEGCLLNS